MMKRSKKAQSEMFDLPEKPPRRKRRFLMHVYDAGNNGCFDVIQFKCYKCGYMTEWIKDEQTVTENKKGVPCPKCNELKEGFKCILESQ